MFFFSLFFFPWRCLRLNCFFWDFKDMWLYSGSPETLGFWNANNICNKNTYFCLLETRTVYQPEQSYNVGFSFCHFTCFLPVFDLDMLHYPCLVSNFYSKENREFTIKLVSQETSLDKISLITAVFFFFFGFPAVLGCIPVFICRSSQGPAQTEGPYLVHHVKWHRIFLVSGGLCTLSFSSLIHPRWFHPYPAGFCTKR